MLKGGKQPGCRTDRMKCNTRISCLDLKRQEVRTSLKKKE